MGGRVLEQLSGVGELFEDGNRLGLARYAITVYQQTHTVGFGAGRHEVDGLQRISGVIDPEAPLSTVGLMLRDTKLSLHLEDGRWWDFAFTSNSGRAVNTGEGIYRK